VSFSLSKTIFISYSEIDQKEAVNLSNILKDLFGEETWIRDFNLNGGDLISEATYEAMTDAKWFIVFVSSSSVISPWLRMEANAATFRSIEDQDFKIIVVKLDKTALPHHLEFALSTKYTLDLSDSHDLQDDFIRLAEYIDRNSAVGTKNDVYVDRGEDSDEFSLFARRNQIVFILGWAGIGKSSFVTQSISVKLRKNPIIIKLTRGHSLDLLARQILNRTHVLQPIQGSLASDQQLTLSAINAIKQREERFFLFLDNAEEGLDGSNQLLPYLELFLEKYIDADIKTHIILATTRNPDITVSISKSADIKHLEGLADEYIKESIDLWLEGTEYHSRVINTPEFDDLVTLIGGHPLAAKMLASFLKVKSPKQLLTAKERRRFELRFAQYILRSADHGILNDLDRLILQILATVKEPMLLEDMLAVKELSCHPLEEIHESRWRLSDLFLIQQDGEMMFLHNFLAAYFQDQLRQTEGRRDNIASQIGYYAYNRAMKFNLEMEKLLQQEHEPEDETIRQLSNDIFRYAIPANRLLRSVGRVDLADNLPIQAKGTLREMVFYFYQEARDYRKASAYAESWLRVSPKDSEVMLYLARCYRNFRDNSSLAKAERVLFQLEQLDFNNRFAARLIREKALIADLKGDTEGAKFLFRQGIEMQGTNPYPENYVGLAQILLREAEELQYGISKKQAFAEEAVRLLETAKAQLATFDRFHLGLYIEALIEAGDENTAFPLLTEALEDKPKDERLNYRIAEILRKHDMYDEAEPYARKAIQFGARKGPLCLSNILYGQALRLYAISDNNLAVKKLEEALSTLLLFLPEYGHDQEIADSIAAKIYRTLGNWHQAHKCVAKYSETKNPYTIYEQCRIHLWEADKSLTEENYEQALISVRMAIARIKDLQDKNLLPPPLLEVLSEAEILEGYIQSLLKN
jgi:Flp pilus assembly protein TadD